MGLVNGVWYDNKIGKMTTLKGKYGHLHKFGIRKNSEGIPIVKCIDCNQSRMYIRLMEDTDVR